VPSESVPAITCAELGIEAELVGIITKNPLLKICSKLIVQNGPDR